MGCIEKEEIRAVAIFKCYSEGYDQALDDMVEFLSGEKEMVDWYLERFTDCEDIRTWRKIELLVKNRKSILDAGEEK